MNPVLFIRAAEAVAEGRQEFSCCAIDHFANEEVGYSQERVLYDELFEPGASYNPDRLSAWGILWSDKRGKKEKEQEQKDCRVLALCFMAAIVEEEDE